MKNKVLVFVDYFLPGYKAGGPIKTILNSILFLSHQYDFFIITRNHDLNDANLYPIETKKWHSVNGYSIMYLNDNEINTTNVKSIIKNYKPYVIYLNSFFSPKLSINIVLRCCIDNQKILLAPRGELALKAIENKIIRKRIFLLYSKFSTKYSNVVFQASNDNELRDIKRFFPNNIVKIVPDLISPLEKHNKTEYAKTVNKLRLCFISRISPIKNLDFCLKILNSKELANDDIQLDIYGPIEDKGYWEECKRYFSNKIKYCGVITPEKIGLTFIKYDFFFFPTKSENFGHVIFESLSVGTPIILSNNTFWHLKDGFDKHSFSLDNNDKASYISLFKKVLKINSGDYLKISRDAYDFALNYQREEERKGEINSLFEV